MRRPRDAIWHRTDAGPGRACPESGACEFGAHKRRRAARLPVRRVAGWIRSDHFGRRRRASSTLSSVLSRPCGSSATPRAEHHSSRHSIRRPLAQPPSRNVPDRATTCAISGRPARRVGSSPPNPDRACSARGARDSRRSCTCSLQGSVADAARQSALRTSSRSTASTYSSTSCRITSRTGCT